MPGGYQRSLPTAPAAASRLCSPRGKSSSGPGSSCRLQGSDAPPAALLPGTPSPGTILGATHSGVSHPQHPHQGPGFSVRHWVWLPGARGGSCRPAQPGPARGGLYPAGSLPLQLAYPGPRYQGSATNVSVLSSSQASPSSSSLSSTHSAPSQMITSAPSSARGKGGRALLAEGAEGASRALLVLGSSVAVC